jgi:hypothetical protein
MLQIETNPPSPTPINQKNTVMLEEVYIMGLEDGEAPEQECLQLQQHFRVCNWLCECVHEHFLFGSRDYGN